METKQTEPKTAENAEQRWLDQDYTAGPWKVSQVVRNSDLPKGERRRNYQGKIAYIWTDRPYPKGVCIAEVAEQYTGQCEANATLMAASPEMLDALVAVLPFVQMHDGPEPGPVTELVAQIQAAIAKATT